MRLLDALKSATRLLEKAGIEDAFADAEVLTFHAAGADRLVAYMENPEITKELLSKIRRVMRRRAKGEPVQYIVGHVDFLGLTISVGKGVLIPRPETELLAEEAIAILSGQQSAVRKKQDSGFKEFPCILDLCTGSGCIALALAKAFPDAEVRGTDVSKKALRYARKNAALNGIKNVIFSEGSLFEPVKGEKSFDLIVSNPPYIETSDIGGLQREIREWEPHEALDGGPDGLDYYRGILSVAAGYLRKDGKIVVELGFGQAKAAEEIARASGFTNVGTKKDYAGIERILTAGV